MAECRPLELMEVTDVNSSKQDEPAQLLDKHDFGFNFAIWMLHFVNRDCFDEW